MARLRNTSSLSNDPAALDQIQSELIASCEDATDWESDRELTKTSLYVTERRTFFVVESFFSFDGRPANSTKPVSQEQARQWCRVAGLDERIIDRYLENAPQSSRTPESVSLLTQHWSTAVAAEQITS